MVHISQMFKSRRQEDLPSKASSAFATQNYMATSAAEFVGKLEQLHMELTTFSQNVEERRRDVFQKLAQFEADSRTFSAAVQKGREGSDSVSKVLKLTLDSIHESIASWHARIERDHKGTEFMHKHEKYLVVMVFGAVKAGKSTLGNFFAGQMLRTAPFDNVYKHIAHPEFATEDCARNFGGIKKDAEGLDWFCEGVTDTTGSIQYFTLSGLRWLDSPGTGALSRAGDSKNMEDMVNEYLPYTDLCIFLMNSSEPGLQADMKYIANLSREGQEALVVITKSDRNEEDVDDEGNLISRWQSKTPGNRKLQEDDICARIKENYPDISEEKYRALSVSTLLAKLAVEQSDEQLYRDSNLPTLMHILGQKVSAEGIALKEVKPKKKVNNFIKAICIGDEAGYGIEQLEQELAKILEPIKEYKQTIKRNTENVSKTVCLKVKSELQRKARAWAQEVEHSGRSYSASELSAKIRDVVIPVLNAELAKKIGDIIEDYQQERVLTLSTNLAVKGLANQSKVLEHNYTETRVRERSSRGFWEGLRSLFGKTYYETYTVNKVKRTRVDLGTNINEWLDEVMPQVQEGVTLSVRTELNKLQETYFQPQEEYVQKMQEALGKLRQELLALVFTMR